MRIKLLILFLVISYAFYSQDNETINLWPDKTQTQESTPTVLPDRGDGVIRITDVSAPALIVYSVPEEKNTGAAEGREGELGQTAGVPGQEEPAARAMGPAAGGQWMRVTRSRSTGPWCSGCVTTRTSADSRRRVSV